MRVAVVDIGTNSTRLLVCDVTDGSVVEVERHSNVTGLGQRVDESGTLHPDAIGRVFAVLDSYRERIDALGAQANTAVLTSAVRDASNGAEFTASVRDGYGLDARTIDGDTEARLTFLGATSRRGSDQPLLVIDIGGGSTELVIGTPGADPSFNVSTQAGVLRQTERHLHEDPPEPAGIRTLGEEITAVIDGAVPAELRSAVERAVAVAGTATTCASIELALEPYDPVKVDGHRLELGTLELQLARLAQMDVEERRRVRGLHPDRAPTIVAGVVILLEALRAFGLDCVEVSERDILHGAALELAHTP